MAIREIDVMTKKQGRCLCGEIVFEYTGAETWCYHCHCESCRRSNASPFTTYVSVPVGKHRFLGKRPAVYNSSPGVRRFFCDICGMSRRCVRPRHWSLTCASTVTSFGSWSSLRQHGFRRFERTTRFNVWFPCWFSWVRFAACA